MGVQKEMEMNRRDFLQLTVAAGFSHGILGANPVYGANSVRKLDRFGGWTGRKFKATGFFRVEKDERCYPELKEVLEDCTEQLYSIAKGFT